MKILFVLENYFPHIGGVEVVFMTLAEGLAKRGHNITVVTHRLKNTKKFEIIRGVKIHRVDCFYSRYLFTFLSIPTALKFAKNADIIHTTTFNGAGPAWLAAKLLSKPIIITIHEVWLNKWKEYTNFGTLKSIIHNLLELPIYLLNYDYIIAVSKSTQKQLEQINKKSKVIYNAIDYNHFNPKRYKKKKNKTFTCLVRGRAGPSKGIEYAIKAFKDLDARLILLLSKDKQHQKYNNYLKSIATNNILFRDPVSWKELPEVISQVDCVIVPSLAEGFGFNATESCAMNIPVIATNTTSLPEVVSGKYILVNPKNSDEIAEAVIKVRNKKYNKSKKKLFPIDINIREYIKVYKSFI